MRYLDYRQLTTPYLHPEDASYRLPSLYPFYYPQEFLEESPALNILTAQDMARKCYTKEKLRRILKEGDEEDFVFGSSSRIQYVPEIWANPI